jgi:hypothetical protein
MLVGQLGPGGAESSMRFGLCLPLLAGPSILFAYTNIEIGIANYLSPAYGHLGPYVQITPLSPLVLRAELTGVTYWPFPLADRAGYFPLDGYDAPFEPSDLPSEMAGSATGFNFKATAILRVRVRLGSRVALVLLDLFEAEYWEVGDATHYFLLRRELVTAASEWVLANEILVGAELSITPAFALRAGVYDSLKYVPSVGYRSNQVGAFVMGYWPRASGTVLELQPLVRLGVYTDHAFRQGGLSLLFGALASYDLGFL